MLTQLKNYISKHEDWLMERILSYAKKRDYTQYTSTLKEAWRLSISGLSNSFINALNARGHDLELGPHEDYLNDPASEFGIVEAKRHRERGISLSMFLGLMKYYRQTYSDLIRESKFNIEKKLEYEQLIKRFFDRVEIGFCTEWSSSGDQSIVEELQQNNREMTNEKNKYLTIFESLLIPVFVVNLNGTIDNMNHAASQMLNFETAPGTQYYGKNSSGKLIFIRAFPWLEKLFNKFTAEENNEKSFKTTVSEENQYFFISFSRSLDISGKFSNTIVIIEDITKRKTMEKELEILATTDPLTGDINRRSFLDLFKKEFQRAKRYNHGLALLMMDIDNFKRINDNFGHGTGDKILKLLFATSSSILRESDIFGRWGGEEFIILLPETDLQKTSAAAERLRGALSKSELLTNDGSNNNFTVSIGFTLIENENAVIEEVIKKADKALYLAKKQGRNRAVYL